MSDKPEVWTMMAACVGTGKGKKAKSNHMVQSTSSLQSVGCYFEETKQVIWQRVETLSEFDIRFWVSKRLHKIWKGDVIEG